MQTLHSLPPAFCWSKMGTEAGEELERIIARKEFERRANEGVFLWGVGNSVMPAIREVLGHGEPLRILFSKMKSPAKVGDVRPGAVVLWLAGESPDGNTVSLPRYSFVTSRGSTAASASKRSHYAMFCFSQSALAIDQPVATLCNDEIANYRTGRPLGASQVTAVVRHSTPCTACEDSRRYQVNFVADLHGPGQIRLTRFVAVDPAIPGRLNELAEKGEFQAWKQMIDDVKRKAQVEEASNPEPLFDQRALAI